MTKQKHKSAETKSLMEKIDDFRYSDTIGATATKILLGILAAGPIILIAATFPNLLSRLDRSSSRNNRYSRKYRAATANYSRKQLNQAYHNLKHRKLIEIKKEKDGKFKVKLTNKGKERIKEYYLESLEIKKPKKWDGKWRLLIFDIPAEPKKFHQAREALRRKIKKLGFRQVQKSVWIYPFECEDEILFIAELFNVQKYIEIITAEKLLHEKELKKKFRLA